MKKQRKHYTPEEKVAILRRHLLEQVPISELCDKQGLQPTVFYRWQKEFFENGAAAFQPKARPNHSAEQERIAYLEKKIQTKDEVLAELMAEHVALKKRLGSLALSPRAVCVPVGLSSPHPGGPADGQLLRLSGTQFYVLTPATARRHRLPMDDAAPVWGSGVHVLASDHGRKPKATNGSSLLGGGWLGALVAFDESGVRPTSSIRTTSA
jgi:transposase